MELIEGKYATATVFADDLEQYARAQLKMLCDNKISEGSRIRVMPDVHPGKVGTIGLTMTIGDSMIPNLLGVDIGCGITLVKLKEKKLELQKLDSVIRERVPSGTNIREKPHRLAEEFEYDTLHCAANINRNKAAHSLGSLGGGNHFIEVGRDSDGNLHLSVHSGSRHLGKEVTDHYIDAGAKIIKDKGLEVPYEMTYLEGELMEQYIEDVRIVQSYAELNRRIILLEILKGMKAKDTDWISLPHNYIAECGSTRLLRKGAISAVKGETVVIPINMKDGLLIGEGLGNDEWNNSAPHGSGRIYRRDKVKNHFTLSAFKSEMKGIYCTCISPETLDEAPFAYRKPEKIMEEIKDTVRVTNVLRPVYNFKAGGRRAK